MTRDDERVTDAQLLDLLLDQYTPAEAARLHQQIDADPTLAARFHRLQAMLSPLDSWTTPPPPTTMVADILDAVARTQPALADSHAQPGQAASQDNVPPTPEVRSTPEPLPIERGFSRRIFSLGEMLAAAACIALLVSAMFPGMRAIRDRSERAACMNNMRSIYQGTSSYAAANAGFLPFAGSIQGDRWLTADGRLRARNSRHLLLVPQMGYTPVGRMSIYVCPSQPGEKPKTPEEILAHGGRKIAEGTIMGIQNIGYHSQFMGGSSPRRLDDVSDPAMGYLADPNPIFDGDRLNSDVDPTMTNSPSHNSKGQNILLFNGQIRWTTTPKYQPVTGDNLWQIEGVRNYTGNEEPAATDAFLTP